jgi:hypothetical protein
MWGHIERFGQCESHCGGCIRIFEDDHQWGDPYRYCFFFKETEPGWIELFGLVGRAPTPSEGRAMLLACKRASLRITRERKAGCRQGTREITRHFNADGTRDGN